MTRPCPDHPRALANALGHCPACISEAARADNPTGLARVRAALHDAPRPPQPAPTKPDPVHDLARARAELDRKAKP